MISEDVVYMDEPYYTVRWSPRHRCVYTRWKTFATSAQFRGALMKGLQAVRENHAVGYISDGRQIKVIVPDDQAWTSDYWMPLIAAAGLKRMALVTAGSGLAKMIIEQTAESVNVTGLVTQTFQSMSAATTWVLTGLSSE